MAINHNADPQTGPSWRIGPWLIPILLFAFAFFRIPPTQTVDYPPQPWEAVLSFGATHHLQWGREIIYTYGPLGFLTNDYYWGDHFWSILIWALTFSIVLTFLLLRFWRRLILPVRLFLCIALPFLTVPRSADLGFDPLYLFAITLIGITCQPDEKASNAVLILCGAWLGLFGLFKFTFCLYALFTLLVVIAANASSRNVNRILLIAGSAAFSFVTMWLLSGQNILNVATWFTNSLKVVSGYAQAMSIPAATPKLIMGVSILMCLSLLLVLFWRNSRKTFVELCRLAIVAAGIFLTWKEGFGRADATHTMVFLLYAILAVTMIPAFFQTAGRQCPIFLPFVAVVWIVVIAFVAALGTGFISAIKTGFVPKFKDTVTAVCAPLHYKNRLEVHLTSRRDAAALPQISTVVGDAPIAVLGYYPEAAILNKFNYQPQPVCQNYSAYTPELQRLNAGFFATTNAPPFVLWHYGTITSRFPGLDDGSIILTMLNNYTPVLSEKECVLWKRNPSPGPTFQFTDAQEFTTNLDHWVTVPTNATWLTVRLQCSWIGHVKEFFYQATLPSIEVRLSDGKTLPYCLVPGEAEAGFIINPLFATEQDLTQPVLGEGNPLRVTAVRVSSPGSFFKDAVHYRFQRINDVPSLDRELTAPWPQVVP